MNIVGCVACGWLYTDTPGMGIHRAPIICPQCGGRVRAAPESVWMENQSLKALISQHTQKPRQRTETNLVGRLIKAASKYGARLWRNNVGTLRDARGAYVTYGLCRGSSDLIGYRVIVVTPDMVGSKVAVFCAIEAKSATGRASDRQQEFIRQVAFDGGIAQVVRSERELELVLLQGR